MRSIFHFWMATWEIGRPYMYNTKVLVQAKIDDKQEMTETRTVKKKWEESGKERGRQKLSWPPLWSQMKAMMKLLRMMSRWWNQPSNRYNNIHYAQCLRITSYFFISHTERNSAECNFCHLALTGASDIEPSTVIIHSITAHRYKLEASYSIVESLESWKPPVGLVQKEWKLMCNWTCHTTVVKKSSCQ